MLSRTSRIHTVFALWIFAIIFSCDVSHHAGSTSPLDRLIPMVAVQAKGHSMLMDTGTSAPAFSFNYDYSLAQTEITWAQWNTVMDLPAPTKDSANLPVTDINWYQAVLFANQVSHKAGLDTVYSYSSKQFLDNGQLTSLTNLQIHYSVFGYRLPSEAEWLFAATGGEVKKYLWGTDSSQGTYFGWFQENSGNTLHNVATKSSLHGFYDLVGNALEWTTDAYGNWPAGASQNYFGMAEDTSATERVVKGGAYTLPENYAEPGQRRAIYAALSSDHFPYLGFRLALGNPTDPNQSFRTRSSADFHLASTIAQLSAYVDNRHFRYAFVREDLGTLVLAEGSRFGVNFEEYSPGVPVRHPMFSPNGNLIAFSTTSEGQNAQGDVYVFDPAKNSLTHVGAGAIPRFHVNGSDTELVYVSLGINNVIVDNIAKDSNWLTQQTLHTTFQDGLVGAISELSPGTFHSGISTDGNWLATASQQLRIKNIASNNVSLLFPNGLDGKQAGYPQICNASLSPEAQPHIAFLDFGNSSAINIVGKPYGIHQYLFIANMDGSSLSYAPVPAPYLGWVNPEWSNLPNLLASNVSNSAEEYSATGIFKVSDHSFMPLVDSSTSLLHPSLWLGDTLGIYSDSLANYSEPPLGDGLVELATKMPLFWKQHSDLEIAITGTSRADQGVLAGNLDWPSLNLAFPASLLNQHARVIRGYMLPHCPKLKAIILSIEPEYIATFNTNDRVFFPSKGLKFDSIHDYWKNGVPDELLIASRTRARLPNFVSFRQYQGTKYTTENQGWGTAATAVAKAVPDSAKVTQGLAFLDSLISDANAQGVAVLGVVFPICPGYKDSQLYSPNLESDSVATVILDRIRIIATKHPLFRLLDENNFGNHDYTEAESQNADHLNYTGALKMTARINIQLHEMLGQ